MTEYVVLMQQSVDDGEAFHIIAYEVARSARSAIQGALVGREDESGQYVAVPARSWKPVTVKVETKTALRFS